MSGLSESVLYLLVITVLNYFFYWKHFGKDIAFIVSSIDLAIVISFMVLLVVAAFLFLFLKSISSS